MFLIRYRNSYLKLLNDIFAIKRISVEEKKKILRKKARQAKMLAALINIKHTSFIPFKSGLSLIWQFIRI